MLGAQGSLHGQDVPWVLRGWPSGQLWAFSLLGTCMWSEGPPGGRSGSLGQCMRLLGCISGFPRGHPTWVPSCCLLPSFEPSWLVAGSGEPTRGSMDIEATPWWGGALRVLQGQVDAQTPGTLVAKLGWRARDRAQLLRGRASPQGRGTFSRRPHGRRLLGQGPTRGLPSMESPHAGSLRDGFQGAGISGHRHQCPGYQGMTRESPKVIGAQEGFRCCWAPCGQLDGPLPAVLISET